MRRLGLVLVVAACGGGGEGGGDVFTVRASQFACEVCMTPCVPAGQQQDCIDNIEFDLGAVRAPGEDLPECLACLRAKIEAVDQIVANGCLMDREIVDALAPSCDSLATQDFDFDGDPTNDLDESCRGAGQFPFFGDVPPEPTDDDPPR